MHHIIGWSHSDKVAHLRWSLTGIAAQLLWAFEGFSYEQLLDGLRTGFSGNGMEDKFQSEFRCRRRNRGDSQTRNAYFCARIPVFGCNSLFYRWIRFVYALTLIPRYMQTELLYLHFFFRA